MKDCFYELLVFCTIVCTAIIILWSALQLDCKINKVVKFIDDYNISQAISINSGFLISVDPNNNWIRFWIDPNYVKIDIKEK